MTTQDHRSRVNVTNTERYLDDDGNPIEEVSLQDARFDRVSLLHDRQHGRIRLRAHDAVTEDIVEYDLDVVDQLFQGARLPSGTLRRDLDDNIEDALIHLSFIPLDGM